MDSLKREPAIGKWWTFCCELDLSEITCQGDIDEVNNSRQYHHTHVWDTREEALAELSLLEG